MPRRKILLVEDNVDHAELTELSLKRHISNIEVIKSHSGKTCMEALASDLFDVIILDYSLPDRNGLLVLKSIKSHKIKTPVIIVTGMGSEATAVKAIKNGAYDYLIKSDGYLVTLPVTVQKVLQNKGLEDLLDETEQRYKDLVENANDGIYVLDNKGQFRLINNKIEEFTGYRREELLKTHFRHLIAKEEKQRWLFLLKQLKDHNNLDHIETVIRTKDGKKIPVELNITPIFKNGEIDGYQGIARDISARIKTDNEIRRQSKELKKLNEELKQKNKELEEINRLKSQFVSNVSHELRTPLNGVLGYAELLRDGIYGQVNDDQKKALQNIISSGNHLLDLINEILDFSKLQNGRMMLYKEICSIYDIIDAVEATVRPIVRNRPIEFMVNIDPDLPKVYVDSQKIYQVFLNVVGNAVKFTSQGEIEIRGRLEGDEILFSVRDTGIGVSKEDIKFVFEEFRQLDGSKTRRFGGTGIGLSLTKQLLELHGGRIWIESELGKGSTFYFTLSALKEALPNENIVTRLGREENGRPHFARQGSAK